VGDKALSRRLQGDSLWEPLGSQGREEASATPSMHSLITHSSLTHTHHSHSLEKDKGRDVQGDWSTRTHRRLCSVCKGVRRHTRAGNLLASCHAARNLLASCHAFGRLLIPSRPWFLHTFATQRATLPALTARIPQVVLFGDYPWNQHPDHHLPENVRWQCALCRSKEVTLTHTHILSLSLSSLSLSLLSLSPLHSQQNLFVFQRLCVPEGEEGRGVGRSCGSDRPAGVADDRIELAPHSTHKS
jgi:hypothetical protein